MPIKLRGWARLMRLRRFESLPTWMQKRAYARLNRERLRWLTEDSPGTTKRPDTPA